MKKNKIILIFLLSFIFIFTACANKNENMAKDNKLKIYTSFYPMYDFTKKIVGDKADVINIVPVGSEPHDYELTTADRKNFEKADLIVYNGAGMEEWIDDLMKGMNKEIFVNSSIGIDLIEGHSHTDDEEHEDDDHNRDNHDKEEHHLDPHIWLSPKNAIKQLTNIYEAVIKIDAVNSTYYKENLDKAINDIKKLDEEYKTKLEQHKGKTIVVSHEAFGYICNDYGINQIGIEGLSPDTEPSPKKMVSILEFCKKNNVKVIFFEELVSPKIADTIAKELGVETKVLNPIEGLSEKELKAGNDYISTMRENLNSIIYSFNK